jgi:asparagine synthase (glutamine-hydrolysing)
MCGIVGVFDLKQSGEELRPQVLEMARRIRHRGPDWSGMYCTDKVIMAHERLAIVDPKSGRQPLFSSDRKLVLAVNGEIYNHQEIRASFGDSYQFLTQSDCEVILALYRQKGAAFFEDLNGIFAFALYDEEQDRYLIGRDHMGIVPLYIGWDAKGNFYVASELKALEGVCKTIQEFLPGHYLDSLEGESDSYRIKPWYNREWREFDNVKNNPTDIAALRACWKLLCIGN